MTIHYGLLDITLRGGTVFQVANALMARNVPFAFTSTSIVPEGYRHAAVLQKPSDPVDLARRCSR